MVLAKYDTSGNSIWARGAHMAIANQSAIDQYGSVFVTGRLAGNPTPNPSATTTFSSPGHSISLSTNKQSEVFVVKYDLNGEVKWGIAPTGPYWSGNFAYSVVHDQNKNCYITGAITGQQTYFGNTMLSNTMSSNIFMAKIKDTIPSVITDIPENEHLAEFRLRPNPGTTSTNLSILTSAQIKSFKIEIINTEGKKISEYESVNEQSYNIDLTGHIRGLYFVRVTANTVQNDIYTKTLKLIVN
jgi:hypothetical protein